MKFLIKTTIFYVICVALAYWATSEFAFSLILGCIGLMAFSLLRVDAPIHEDEDPNGWEAERQKDLMNWHR